MTAQTNAGSLAQLFEIIEEIQAQIADKKKQLDATHNLIDLRLADKTKAALLTSGKDTGIVHIHVEDLDVTAEIKKTVKWDQPALLKAFDSLPQETAKHYCSMELKIDERKYTNAPPDIQKAFLPARTVTPSTPKYSLSKKEEKE